VLAAPSAPYLTVNALVPKALFVTDVPNVVSSTIKIGAALVGVMVGASSLKLTVPPISSVLLISSPSRSVTSAVNFIEAGVRGAEASSGLAVLVWRIALN